MPNPWPDGLPDVTFGLDMDIVRTVRLSLCTADGALCDCGTFDDPCGEGDCDLAAAPAAWYGPDDDDDAAAVL